MKAILMSSRPKSVAEILNGKKKGEARKNAPKPWIDYFNGESRIKPCPIEVYIYCTKSDYIGHLPNKYIGKVVAKFTLREMFVYNIKDSGTWEDAGFAETVREQLAMPIEALHGYAGDGVFYQWVISDLMIFDEPKELNQFQKVGTLAAYQEALDKACEEDMEIAERRDEEIAWCGESSWLPNCAELTEAAYQMGAFGLTRAPQSWQYAEVRE